MKPDKHKKEKNAIYKKKHGITDGSKQEHKVSEKLRDTQVKDKTRSICDGPSTDLSDKAEEETLASNSNETRLETQGTNYGRRKVMSNWERYEVEETTALTVRGSDFAALLKSSASVLSHSQYRDELGLLKREDSTQHTPTKFLSLDCDDLANSLMCIPLHERLGIEASVFEPLMIQQYFELSKESALNYGRALAQVESSANVALDYTSAETANRNAEEQVKVKSHDLLVGICSTASTECPLNMDDCHLSLVNNSPKYVEESVSSSELSLESQQQVQTSTDSSLTATVTQPELEVGKKTPQSSLSTSSVEDKVAAGSKCGAAPSLKELENELDLLLAM